MDAVKAKEEGVSAEDRTYSYKDEGLLSSTRYYYIVRALNPGAGPWSDFLTAFTTPGNPDAPMLTATAVRRYCDPARLE